MLKAFDFDSAAPAKSHHTGKTPPCHPNPIFREDGGFPGNAPRTNYISRIL
jgi:hypothetical protein